ncbi:hypothetical protein SSX86_008473 [Deinandra increscens subsp. villosa]|uniref:Uncharacterized protein n=1 Tax=Deinandra increscens subsp. villosa TaxID=3103831 RepID=A0AAP0DBC2_9ASTR
MPLHFMLVAKVKLLGVSQLHTFTATPILASLIWPFCCKLVLSFRPIKDIVQSMAYDLSLFVFQLGQIVTSPADAGRRWEQIVLLAHQRFVSARESLALVTYHDNFHTLSMVAL